MVAAPPAAAFVTLEEDLAASVGKHTAGGFTLDGCHGNSSQVFGFFEPGLSHGLHWLAFGRTG